MNLKFGQLSPRERIIVALDVPERERALQLVRELRDSAGMFKVGLQLFIADGPAIVRAIRDEGADVFLDLKLHDIPNTVARAVESAAQLGVSMLTLHLAGGAEMIRAAVSARSAELLLLGVTVLTSSIDETLRATGVEASVNEQVVRLATLGRECGIRGFVASAHELSSVRQRFGRDVVFVIPGLRPTGVALGDQQRVMSPGEAVRLGADYLVIGRPITSAAEPRAACEQILAEISAVA